MLALKEKWKPTLVKSILEEKYIIQDRAKNRYQYEEEQPIFKWTLNNETKEILGYNCKKQQPSIVVENISPGIPQIFLLIMVRTYFRDYPLNYAN